MLHTKFRGNRSTGSVEEYFNGFNIHGHGGHLGHVTQMPRTPRWIHIKIVFDRPIGFGEDVEHCGRTPEHIL